MDFELLFVAFLAVASLVLCVTGRVTLDVIGIGLLAILVLTGLVPPRDALSGFSNGTIIMLGGLFVIGEALTRTGALEFLAAAVLKASRGSELRMTLLLCFTAAALSAFASSTVRWCWSSCRWPSAWPATVAFRCRGCCCRWPTRRCSGARSL